MKKLYPVIITAFVLISFHSRAQISSNQEFADEHVFTYEGGISLDDMNCLTDIGGNKGTGKKFFKDVNLGYGHVGVGIFFSASIRNTFSLRLEGTFGKIAASDRTLSGITDIAKERYNRNLNFQSKINEIALIAEVHPLYFFHDRYKENKALKVSPYLLGGVGDFSFNPKALLGDRKVSLKPLHTEGEGFAEYPDRKNYSLNQVNIPLGLGVKYQYSSRISFRAEFVYRKIFTDYLDDVSTNYIDPVLFDQHLSPDKAADARKLADRQIIEKANPGGKRGSPEFNDGYFSFNLKASISLFNHRN